MLFAALAVMGSNGGSQGFSMKPPILINPAKLFRSGDFPRSALNNSNGGLVSYQVVVSPTGSVERCDVQGASGSNDLAQQTCAILNARAKFEPAVNAKGEPSFGVYRGLVTWATEDWDGVRLPGFSDLSLKVNRLPNHLRPPLLISAAVAVDAKGIVTGCRAFPRVHEEALAPLACGQIEKLPYLAPARSLAGQPVASIQRFVIDFALVEKPSY